MCPIGSSVEPADDGNWPPAGSTTSTRATLGVGSSEERTELILVAGVQMWLEGDHVILGESTVALPGLVDCLRSRHMADDSQSAFVTSSRNSPSDNIRRTYLN